MAQTPITQFRPAALTERGFPSSPFNVLQRQMNRLLEDVFGSDANLFPQASEPARGMLSPRIEVTETENDIRVIAELPGVKEQEIEVSLDEGMLSLRAEKKVERKEERENIHFSERSYGMFQRTLQLPFQVDPDQVSAAFENGVLTITVPKPKGREQKRKIEVRGTQQQPQSGVSSGGNGGSRPPA
jgi:HSP20 family protein